MQQHETLSRIHITSFHSTPISTIFIYYTHTHIYIYICEKKTKNNIDKL